METTVNNGKMTVNNRLKIYTMGFCYFVRVESQIFISKLNVAKTFILLLIFECNNLSTHLIYNEIVYRIMFKYFSIGT